jgi:hypothetical protein
MLFVRLYFLMLSERMDNGRYKASKIRKEVTGKL